MSARLLGSLEQAYALSSVHVARDILILRKFHFLLLLSLHHAKDNHAEKAGVRVKSIDMCVSISALTAASVTPSSATIPLQPPAFGLAPWASIPIMHSAYFPYFHKNY